jgi:hypothetical protein
MLDLEIDLLQAHPDWQRVLQAYAESWESPPVADSETSELASQGWRPRLKEVDGVAPEEMTRIHGKLIAHGFLQVEIAGRTGGLLYQLSSVGRQAGLRLADAP